MPRVVLALAFVFASACSASARTSGSAGASTVSPGTGSEGKPAAHAGGASGATTPESDAGAGAGPAGPGAPAGGAVASAPCVPELADVATALFGTRIVIRLPKGLELAERNPFYAQAASASQVSTCGQPFRYAAVGFAEFPASATPTMFRDQLMELRGLPAASLTWSDEGSRGRTFTGAYAAPADDKSGAPAVSGWLVIRESGDKYVYFAFFETDPGAAWDALKPTFIASGKNFFIKPRPAGSPASTGVAAPAPTPPPATGGGLSVEPTGTKKKKKSGT